MIWMIIIFVTCALAVIALSLFATYSISKVDEYLDYDFYSDDEGL